MTHLVDEFYTIVSKTPGTTDALVIVTVPEPGAWALLLTGLIALGCIALLRQRADADRSA